jgi:hypothetical protein
MPVLPLVASISRSPGAIGAALEGGPDHPVRGAVLDAAAGVLALELRQQLHARRRAEPREPHQRRVADQVDQPHQAPPDHADHLGAHDPRGSTATRYVTRVPGGTLRVSQTLPPTTLPRPMTVSPPRMVAPA